MTEKDDNQLLKEYVNGDIKGFESLYTRHKGGTYRFFLRQLGQDSAEDLHQELWKKVVTSAVTFQFNARFTTWLYQMARNLVTDRFRHLAVVEKVVDTDEKSKELLDLKTSQTQDMSNDKDLIKSDSGGTTPGADMEVRMRYQTLLFCMQKLPKVQLESFVLKQEGGFTHAEIAQIVDASLEAVKSRVKTAVENLKGCVSSKLTQEVA